MQKTAIGFLWAWLRHRSITQTLLVMKLTLVFLITACLAMHASGVSQSVTISGKDLSLKEVFATVKQQTGFFVFYNEVLLKDAKPVSLTVVNLPLPSLLDKVLKDQPISYRIDGKTIILSRKVLQQKGNGSGVDNLNSSFGIFPVKGHITDSDGNPLSGINVMVRGTKNGTVSDINGNFIINASAGDILLFSSIGFQSIERTISDNSPLTITLTPSITKLDDVKVVVNTGYQEISRERSTGSFAHINNKLFNRKVSTNLLDRITEVTSGLNYQPPASDQGRGTITIRGISTINASQEPLIVVDNFPYDGNIRNINPNDVLSVTVLKDAAAASIWGVRAGNGVIVITTKQGQYNKNASIQFNSNVNVIDKPDIYYAPMASSKDMVDFQKQLFATGNYNIFDDLLPVFGAFPVIPEAIELMLAKRRNDINQGQLDQALAALEKNDVRRDIDKYFLQSGINQQYSLNVSGGTNNYKY